MGLYRKKPVVVEAYQFAGDIDFDDAPGWLRFAIAHFAVRRMVLPELHLVICTMEGEMRAYPGDWIIRGVRGELHPCKPDIFAATYEPAGEE